MTLSRQLLVGLLVFVTIMMSATYIMLEKSDGLLKEYTLAGLEREGRLLTSILEQNLLERYHNASIFPLVLGELKDEKELGYTVTGPEFLDSLNQMIKNYKVYRRIVIIDVHGNIIAQNSKNYLGKTISNAALSLKEIKASPWYIEVSNENDSKNDVFFYGPDQRIIDYSNKQYDLLIGSKIYSNEGELIGYWLNILDFSIIEDSVGRVYTLLAEKGLPYVELTLLNERGQVIVDYDPIVQKSAKYERNFSVLGKLNLVDQGVEGAKLAVAGLTGSVVSVHARKQVEQFTAFSHFTQYQELSDLRWSALIRADKNIAYSDYLDLRTWNYWLFFLALILITAISSFALKRFTLPLKNVTRNIMELSGGNLEPNIEKTSHKDEVSSINNALVELKSKLKERESLIQETQKQQVIVELQKKAMNSMASGIMISDAKNRDLNIIYVNKAMELLTGYRLEELLNKTYQYLWGKETEIISSQMINDAINNSEGCTCVITNYRKDRTTFINNMSVDPVFDEFGQLSHYIFVHNDITEIKKDDEIARFALEKKIETSVRESKETAKRLRTVFDTALDGSVVMNQDGIIIDVNHSLEVIFGRNKSELLGKNVSILMPSEHAKVHNEYIQNYFKDGIKKFIGELRTVVAIHKSGRQIPIEISIGETKLENETIFVAAIRDISEQQEIKEQQLKLQNRLQERETIYRTAFNQAAVGIARVSVDGQLLEVNNRLCENLGYTEEELLKLNVEDITFEEDIELSRRYLRRLAEGRKQLYTLDKRYIRKDKSVFWANLGISLVRSDIDEPKYYISIIEDITERKSFEQELRDAKDQRDELIGGINLASRAGGICNWSYNMVTDELKWDPGTYLLYGIPHGQKLTYSDWRERVIPADIDRIESEINNAIQKDLSLESEFRFTKQGCSDIRWAKVALAITMNNAGEPVKMFGINIDITEQKRITSELEKESIAAREANEAKSRFLATMSHEIRTPMNGVIGMIDLLKKTTLNADQKRMTSTIRDSSYALLDIINDILDFSKIESGQIDIEWTSTSVLNILEKTIGSLSVSAVERRVDLIIEHDTRTPKKILADSMRLGQILLNLVGNAIKFSHYDDKRGIIRVVSYFNHSNSELMIKVIDNGIGISEVQQKSLFVPFSQADSSTTRKYGGTGLGLSISKSFVELMGGEIWVKSEIAKGSEFSIKIPVPEIDDKTPDFENTTFSGFSFYINLESSYLSNSCVSLLNKLGADQVLLVNKEKDSSLCVDAAHNQSKIIYIYDTREAHMSTFDSMLQLQVESDPIKKKGLLSPYKYVVSGTPLKPSEFVLGLMILCGLESPDFIWSGDDFEGAKSKETAKLSHTLTNGKKILVVEDHPTNQLVIGRQLECLGVEYQMTADGVEGLAEWDSGDFDLILTDCHMPNMDGFELTRRIRSIESTVNRRPIPIIAITANALVGESEICLQAGMDDYIAKPVEVERLKSIITKWLTHCSSESSDIAVTNDLSQEHISTKGLDLEILYGVIGTDDMDIVSEILEMFWDSVHPDLKKLEKAISENDVQKVKSLAHASKGSSASSGAQYLSELFKVIEKNPDNQELILDKLGLIKCELVEIEAQLIDLEVITNA